jgi:glycosyltransferase involved in cell wall biosynthesis
MRPLVSVIIATLNREKPLCDTIDYFLSREIYRPFEMIVIDQSEEHDTATTKFLKNLASRIDHRRPKYKNVCRARNEGIASAKGEIIVFVDDDVQPFDGFLDGHVAPYVNKKVWAVTGPSISPGEHLLTRTIWQTFRGR